MSRWLLSASRERDSTTSLGNLFQCSVSLTVKEFFLMFRCNFLCFSLCPFFLFLSAALYWNCSRSSMSSLHWGAQNWTQCSKWILIRDEKRERITFLDLQAMLFYCSPGYHWPSSPQGHLTASWTTCCLPGLQGPLCRAAFQKVSPQNALSYFSILVYNAEEKAICRGIEKKYQE